MIILILTLFYLFTRLYHLTLLPIFFDEANFVFWAKQIAATGHHWFISLSGGKNFLIIWLMVPFLKLLNPSSYLTAGRLPSVISGFFTLLAIYKISTLLFKSRRIAIVSSVFYILSPFFLLYDRLALYDSLLAATMTWTVYFTLKCTQSLKLSDTIKWGLVLGLAFLSKASAIFYLILTPLVFFILTYRPRKYPRWKLPTIALIISQIVANIILLSRGYHDYLTKSLDYSPSATHLLAHPLFPLLPNLLRSFDWLVSYHTPFFFLLCVVSLGFLIAKHRRIGLSFLALTFIPIFVFSFFGRVYFPRYLLFTTPYLLISSSLFLDRFLFKAPGIFILCLTVTFFLLGSYDFWLLTNPLKAPLPTDDKRQYITGFPSGYGLTEIYGFLDKKLAQGPLTLVIQGSYSHYPNAFYLEYWGNPQVHIIERWPLWAIDNQILEATRSSTVYFVIPYDQAAPNQSYSLSRLPLSVILTATKPGGRDPIYLATLKK